MNKKIVFLALLIILLFTPIALGTQTGIDVGTGLAGTKELLGSSIEKILKGLAYFIGIAAAGALIFCGFRLIFATDDRIRAQAKMHIGWIFGGVAVAALSFIIVGYVVSLVV